MQKHKTQKEFLNISKQLPAYILTHIELDESFNDKGELKYLTLDGNIDITDCGRGITLELEELGKYSDKTKVINHNLYKIDTIIKVLKQLRKDYAEYVLYFDKRSKDLAKTESDKSTDKTLEETSNE